MINMTCTLFKHLVKLEIKMLSEAIFESIWFTTDNCILTVINKYPKNQVNARQNIDNELKLTGSEQIYSNSIDQNYEKRLYLTPAVCYNPQHLFLTETQPSIHEMAGKCNITVKFYGQFEIPQNQISMTTTKIPNKVNKAATIYYMGESIPFKITPNQLNPNVKNLLIVKKESKALLDECF